MWRLVGNHKLVGLTVYHVALAATLPIVVTLAVFCDRLLQIAHPMLVFELLLLSFATSQTLEEVLVVRAAGLMADVQASLLLLAITLISPSAHDISPSANGDKHITPSAHVGTKQD